MIIENVKARTIVSTGEDAIYTYVDNVLAFDGVRMPLRYGQDDLLEGFIGGIVKAFTFEGPAVGVDSFRPDDPIEKIMVSFGYNVHGELYRMVTFPTDYDYDFFGNGLGLD